jgi:cysteine desulfurase
MYFDHHAATPLLPAVREAMARADELAWANPSSVHAAGRAAKSVLEKARAQVAAALEAHPVDLVLTAGATEACNVGVLGLARAAQGRTLLTTSIEHPAVLGCLAALEAEGWTIRRLPVLAGVPPSPDQLASQIDGDTSLVIVQWVNHETGTLFPIHDYAARCAERGVGLFVDACAALGKVPVSVKQSGVAGLVVSAAKIGGPAGAAALWVERCREVSPVIHGGAQERGRRPGTPNVAVFAGFGTACAALPERLAAMPRVGRQRDRLEGALHDHGAQLNGHDPTLDTPRVNTVSNVSLPGWRSDMLVAALDIEGLCASSGAACSSGLAEPSPVLRAMYPQEPARAESALRLSLGPETTDDEVERAVDVLGRVLARAR